MAQKDTIISGYTDNIKSLYYDFKNDIDDLIYLCKNNPSKIKKSAAVDSSITVQLDNKTKMSMCDIIKMTAEWTVWIGKVSDKTIQLPLSFAYILAESIGESVDFINDLAHKGIEFVVDWITKQLNKIGKLTDRLLKWCIKRLKLVTLNVKKWVLYGQLFILKMTRGVLQSMQGGKFIEGIQDAYKWIVNAIKKTAEIIDIGLKYIDMTIDMLVTGFFSIDGGAMCFLLTPKTIMTGVYSCKVNQPEETHTICDGISDKVFDLTNEYIEKKKTARKAIKTAYVAKQLAIAQSIGDIPDMPGIELDAISDDDVTAFIKSILSLYLVSEPLPKYERLSLTNLGYMYWLIMGFEPAMKKCFGFPGQP